MAFFAGLPGLSREEPIPSLARESTAMGGFMRTRTIHYAALAGVMVFGLSEGVAACGWSCRDGAPGLRRTGPSYGYRAYLAPARPAPLPSRQALRAVAPPPGGNTTMDPPGFMSAQGILETPVTTRGPTLLNPGGFAYGYNAPGAPRARRTRSTY
jgi:hypothetical protein